LNSAVNERRGRDFLRSTFSMMDILFGDKPLILDVRQSGSVPAPPNRHRSWSPAEYERRFIDAVTRLVLD